VTFDQASRNEASQHGAVTPAWKRGFSLTSEQLEAARAERMRQNGHGALTLEDACTWLEETGLCLFLPKRQFSNALAPSFVEAIAGQRNGTPDQKQIAVAEELLVRLEEKGVAVRLNLLGTPGEQPDYVVAAWVLPYVYALRGDRDWRRTPQLTGSRAVSPLAIQLYKRLESNGEANVAELKQALGGGVTEVGVIRAITELWQQLRIIPVLSAPAKPAKWQLLRIRFQKAIAEGASTSQVTAISVLASIFLQAVIAASMEEVEIFLSPLTARSKIREVLRGLVATRQVHTLSLGHAPHFYVAGTLPEFAPTPTIYASTLGSTYLSQLREEEAYRDVPPAPARVPEHRDVQAPDPGSNGTHAPAPAAAATNGNGRPHFARPSGHARDRKPSPAPARRPSESRPSRPAAASRNGTATRWNGAAKNGSHTANGHAPAKTSKTGSSTERTAASSRPAASGSRTSKSAAPAWKSRNGNHAAPARSGNGSATRSSGLSRTASTRKDARPATHTSRGNRKPAMAGGTNGKRYGLTAKGTKKH
jgi:23S rRNA pseudouridine2605 synthase